MRLSPEKIKQAILDADQDIRDAALYYFSSSFSQDSSIMPLAIQAMKQYGWQEAFSFPDLLDGLVQSEESVAWLIEEINKAEDSEDKLWPAYQETLQLLLAEAETSLLSNQQQAIAKIDSLSDEAGKAIEERIRLSSEETQSCWDELEKFCEKEKNTEFINEADIDHAYRLIEAIARDGQKYADRVISILEQKVEDYESNPQAWMEVFIVRLAGEMRLVEAADLILEKLKEGVEWLNEECVWALVKIGSDTTVEQIADLFPNRPAHLTIYSSAILEKIHGDLSVKRCLDLFTNETDPTVAIYLGQALLAHFPSEAIEPIRQFLLPQTLSPDLVDLKRSLLAASVLLEIDFPEYAKWKEESVNADQLQSQWYNQEFPVVDAAGGFVQAESGTVPVRAAAPKRMATRPYARRPQTAETAANRAGRNDPCPCGSGKKYKKCCLPKQSRGQLF